MKAITLRQPTPAFLTLGVKTVETLTWEPPRYLHGQRIAIYAARREMTRKDLALLSKFTHRDMPRQFRCIYGGVVATARLVTVFRVEGISVGDNGAFVLCDRSHDDPCPGIWHTVKWDVLSDFTPGRYCWVFDRIEPLAEPVPEQGEQGLWDWEPQSLEVAK